MSPETGEPDERISHPNRGTLGQPFPGSQRLNLSASQLHDHENEPSWKAPPQRGGLSAAALIALVIAIAAAVLIVLWAAGVI